jgi:hypothetical protein
MLVFAYLHSVTGWRTVWIIIQESLLLIGVIILVVSVKRAWWYDLELLTDFLDDIDLASSVRYQDGRILPPLLFLRRRSYAHRKLPHRSTSSNNQDLTRSSGSQGWMSEHFQTPEERSIIIGLAVTFVFPMSAWMSSRSQPTRPPLVLSTLTFHSPLQSSFTLLNTPRFTRSGTRLLSPSPSFVWHPYSYSDGSHSETPAGS